MVETLVAISIIGVGAASTVGALTKINAFASASRNSTGAYTAAMNQIDKILSASPFVPQNKNSDGTAAPQIPAVLTVGTTTQNNIPIYKDPTDGVIVPGVMETTVTDISNTSTPVYMYRVAVTVAYQYLGRGPVWSATRNRWEYQFSMSTVRASDK